MSKKKISGMILQLIIIVYMIASSFITVYGASDPYTNEEFPYIESTYAYLIDADSGQVLFSQNAEERMYPASMTKVMVEILAIENLDLNQSITITEDMWAGLIEANASTAGFYPGTTVTVMDLLYGSALPSGADAVNALAMFVSGSVSSFVDLMNAKAAEIGMTQTHFTNVTGLHNADHYSSAKDIAALFTYCLKNETFQQLIGAHRYIASNGTELQSTVWSHIDENEGYFITGFEGGKSGYTVPAGRCLVSAAHFNGMHLVLVTGLAPDSAVHDASTLYNYFADRYQKTSIIYEGNKLGEIAVRDSSSSLSYYAPETVIYDLPKDAQIVTSLQLDQDEFYAPIHAGDHIGTYTISINGSYVKQYDWIADTNVDRNLFKYIVRIITAHPFRMLFIIVFLVFVNRWIRLIRINRRKRRRKKRRRS